VIGLYFRPVGAGLDPDMVQAREGIFPEVKVARGGFDVV
jgi:hypothetical protein